MKYWRRHKHELEPQTDGSVQAPYTPIGKKSRYTKEDDILLAKYFFVNQRPPSNAPGATGLANPIPGKTSDAIFQEFAKLVSRTGVRHASEVDTVCFKAPATPLERVAGTPSVAQAGD
jgi:hypothetical protein